MLALRDIHAGYGAHAVLHGVDLVVPDGAVVALLGPNGAGKTTLLRVASGLLRPTRGRLLLDGRDVTGRSPHRLAADGVCHVPEGRGIFRKLTVGDNLRLQAAATSAPWASVVREAFPRLHERLAQTAGSLSGGEQQMLALARARMTEARVVLLDEVSLGLAPNIVDAVYEHLRALAEAGTAMLLVEQYAHRALALADYVVVLRKGEVVFVGEPDQLGDEELRDAYLA